MGMPFTTRLPSSLAKSIEFLAKIKKSSKSTILRQLIERGLKEKLTLVAIELLRKGEVTLWKAAEIANMSLWDFMEEVKKRKIIIYDQEDLEKDLDVLRRFR
ncbi:MAG: UPF0175 family protein [Candidatus Baldrarchaeia archaeon]